MFGTVIMSAALIVLSITVVLLMRGNRQFRRMLNEYHQICENWETEFAKVNGVSSEFLNACRLLAIHRNGRLNVFTFARNDDVFSIETMGLLSDNVEEWRKQAGLSSDQRRGLTQ